MEKRDVAGVGASPPGSPSGSPSRWLQRSSCPWIAANPPVRNDVDAPAEVAAVLRAACYDCHSHETRWPWYSRVAPVSWSIARPRGGRPRAN